MAQAAGFRTPSEGFSPLFVAMAAGAPDGDAPGSTVAPVGEAHRR